MTSTDDAVDASAADHVCRTSAQTCTLRAAIQQANALPGADAITLTPGTYELAIPPLNQNLADVGDLDITDSLTITGAGAGSTFVDGGTPPAGSPPQVPGLDRLFEVAVDDGTVVFLDVTLRDGWAAEYGGAIMNSSSATVRIVDSALTGNEAGKTGGAIDNHFEGTVEVEGSTLSDNYAAESGSALNNNRGGALTVTDSVVSSNSAADAGLDETLAGAGAISNNAELDARGTITVTGSRISDNRAGGGRSGAGISNDGAGTVSVTGTVFASNRAVGDGGAIFNVDGEVTVAASTFSENAGKDGGAISSSGLGFLTVSDSTFSKNSASDWGGAIQNGNKGSVSIRSSSFTENSGLNGGGFGNEGAGLVTVENSTFTKNVAVDTATAVGGEGGGMHSNSGGEVVVSGGAFTENRALSGGGFSNEGGGRVTISGTRFETNRADEAGGGILIESGDVRMVDIDVVGNLSDSPLEGGGGISYAGDKVVSVGETAAIESSRIRNNTAKGDGGGIDSRGDGTLVITTTAITGNTAAIGGAIHHVGDAPLEVRRSTLSGNFGENGGGMFTDGDGETTVENTTVSGNRAGQFGGGFLVSSRLILRSSTISENSAAAGGGINNGGGDLVGDGFVFLANTILAGNPGSNCAGTVTSHGGNVEAADTCQLRELSDQPGTDPRLGPLASNGGPTQMHALLAGSPAQEKAVCTEVDPCPATDQRGVARPAFAGFDAGAYESELTPSGSAGPQPCTGRIERPVQADFDSWISQSAPSSNFGDDSILKVDPQAGANERALVHFTLPSIPPGCKLVGASLRLYSSAATDGRTLDALRIVSSWSESDVTWANQPATAGVAASTDSGLDLREWDVLEQTLDMYGLGGHGFLLRDRAGSGSGEQSFHSQEKGADRPPELILVFDDPDAPPASGSCSTSPLSLAADRDSWISQSAPSDNFGTDSTLKVKSQGGSNSRALVRFPLPTLAGGCTTVASATLRLEATSAKEGRMLQARPAASAWTESGVTWANQPAVSGPTAETASLDGSLEWDVSAGVLAMYVSANHGFVIRDAEENGVGDEQTINSRHKITDVPPELLLRFDDSTPETTIGSWPVSPTESPEATFTFSSDRVDATFECALDAAAFAPCTSPNTVRGLALGGHTFQVRATRPVRAVDPSPASFGWSVVDLTPPVVTLTGPTGETEETIATFSFSADEEATLACTLDGIVLADCASPLELADLALGAHTFEVEATDPSGNTGQAAHGWTVVDLTAPTVSLTGPPAQTEDRGATLTFSTSEPATVACTLNGAAVLGCASPQTLGGLVLGGYVFELSATDPSGNVGTASYGWTVVDRTAPVVTITGPPPETEEQSAELAFSASEAASFACTLNAVAVVGCASPLLRSGFGLGRHSLEVEATDPSGNVGSASYGWTVVDRTAPVVTITGPPAETEARSAELTFSASEAASFACTLNAVAVVGCASPHVLTGLTLGAYVFEVSATDPSENVGTASVAWTVVDRTAPVVTITGPPAATEERSATLSFSVDEPAAIACSLDGVALGGCPSPLTVGNLALGAHTFEVEATDASGNAGSATYGWTVVDRTAPTVAISGPTGETSDTTAELAFSASEAATFACTLDGVAVTPCASPVIRSGFALGIHTFEVSATDGSGNTGSASRSWTIVEPPDTTAPVVTLAGPANGTHETDATFTFSANENVTFACTLDGVAVAPCASPVTRAGLALGGHSFDVVATDAAGNSGSASHGWTIVAPPPPPDTTAPVITLAGPADGTQETGATFTFSADEPAGFQCALDAAGFDDCISGITYGGLLPGEHEFRVRATDGAGNVSAATHVWTIVPPPPPPDTTAPIVTLDGPPAGTEEPTATFVFSADEPVTFTCSLDGVDVAGCASPLELDGLEPGEHMFEVDATDAAGNTAGASHTWTIVAPLPPPPPPNATAPAITLTGPASGTQSTNATFTFSADEPATFRCRLDGAGFDACTSGIAYSGLQPGEHVFRVEATDTAHNVASASHTWTIVAPPPPPPSCTGGTATVGANADSWILESSATSNYRDDSVLKVDTKAGANARALVRFALPAIPSGCSLNDVKLRLYAGSYKEGRTLQALPTGSTWGEASVTWSSQPVPTGAAITASSGSGYVQWNVTSQIVSPTGNVSFLIRDATENGSGIEQGFHSREKGTDNPPQLVVTFG